MQRVVRGFARLRLSSGVSKPLTLGTLTNFCTNGTPNSQTPQTIEFTGCFEMETDTSRLKTTSQFTRIQHGKVDGFPVACHIYSGNEFCTNWHGRAIADRNKSYIYPRYMIKLLDGKVLIISTEVDSTLFQLVKNSPLELKQVDSEILTSKFKLILRNTVEMVGHLKEKPYSATSFDWHSLYLVAGRVRCAIPNRTDLVIDPVVSFRSVIREVIDKLSHRGTMIELETLHNLTLRPMCLDDLLSHPSLLSPKKRNGLRMWSYAKFFQTHHLVDCTQGYILRLVTAELENVYASHGGDPFTLNWKTSFELQDYGSRLRHLVRDYNTNYDGSNMLDFLELSRHIAMDAKHSLGITDAEIDTILSNSFPGFLGVLFESTCNLRRRNHVVNFTSTWRYTAK